jgi:transcription termination factor Rho
MPTAQPEFKTNPNKTRRYTKNTNQSPKQAKNLPAEPNHQLTEGVDPGAALVDAVEVNGVLDMMNDGYGFLRQDGLIANYGDVYVSSSQIRRFGLRVGDTVTGMARKPKDNEKYFGLLRVDTINGQKPEETANRPRFEKLTPIYPDKQIHLETKKEIVSTRLLDLVSPIGRGQRGMIVAQPKAGKTYLIKDIANGITTNYKDIKLMVVLIGERPEEVTDISRSVNGEVFASNFDEPSDNQVKVAELALEKAKRAVETGQDIVILLDSITRLARAYNLAIPPSGRTLSGGFDPAALYPPKRFFGAARNVENGGSLTIIATALIDTGSRMDDLIYEEFKGTGNMELHLDRKLSERRIYPSIDVTRSGTRHEELLFNPEELKLVWRMRRMIETLGQGQESTELILDRLQKTDTNADFLATLHKSV